ncbi:FixH family protein, partial [Mycobacterium tuberculosis]|nr:FixH family protein [Mycobacterium tuberculosis]
PAANRTYLAGVPRRRTLQLMRDAGAPVEALALTARLEHPVKQGEDAVAALATAGAGRYTGAFEGVEAGLWTLVVEAASGNRRVWRSEN